jgi:glycosyltransferase involved in cell wall biosynthesis
MNPTPNLDIKLAPKPETQKVALLLHDLEKGGMQAVCLNLIQAFQAQPNLDIELVLSHQTGGFAHLVPATLKTVNLNLPFALRLKYIAQLSLALAQYLRQSQPDVIVSNLPFVNLATLLAKFLAQSRVYTLLIEHTLPLEQALKYEENRTINPRLATILTYLMRWLYPYANHIVAPSQGMLQVLATTLNLKPHRPNNLQVIYNPVVNAHLISQAQAPLEHPWFEPNQPPVLVAVGRLTPQKDYVSLLHAFAQLRQDIPARLIILGDGEMRAELEALVQQLAIAADVALPGFVDNPYAYMSRAAAFVLSSVWETFGIVLVEALACGCPVLSTNCDYGPSEILADGQYGALVPVKNPQALAQAMKHILKSPKPNPQILQHRADEFSLDHATHQYLAVMGVTS